MAVVAANSSAVRVVNRLFSGLAWFGCVPLLNLNLINFPYLLGQIWQLFIFLAELTCGTLHNKIALIGFLECRLVRFWLV